MKLYLITNLVNGKMYVGITSRTVAERWLEHKQEASRGGKRALLSAIRKYGAENFDICEVGSADDWQSLCHHERLMIEGLRTLAPHGYNLTSGGDGVLNLPQEIRDRVAASNRGRKQSDEAKRKIGAASKGHVLSPEARAKISLKHMGKTLSPEHRAKLSAAKVGKKRPPRSDEHSAKISEGLKRAWARRKGQA